MASWWASYIARRAPEYGLDPKAVLSVAAGEGLSGGVGDNGHAFGPFQLNDAGGVLTGQYGSSAGRRRFAESKAGIDFALSHMARVGASGQTGAEAIETIIRKFERPADPDTSVRNALPRYNTWGKVRGAKPAGVAEGIDAYLTSRGSPMAGLGGKFVAAGKAYGVDPRLLVGIGVMETGAGEFERHPKNFANWGVHQGVTYDNYDDAITALAKGVRDGYVSQGLRTPKQIANKYAPASDGNDPKQWASSVKGVMKQISGSVPRELTGRGGAGFAPSATEVTPYLPSLARDTSPIGKTDFRSLFGENLLSQMMSGDRLSPGSMLRTLMQSKQQAAMMPAPAAPRMATPPPSLSLPPAARTVPGGGTVSGPGARGGIRELFYDPLGAYDEGNWISPIGGHSDHVHVSFGDRKTAIQGIKLAKQMGLRASENPYAEHSQPEPGVHTSTSYHYQMFPGKVQGWQVGKGLDVSGPSAKMAEYFRKIKSRL